MSESGRETLCDLREWSRDPLGCPGVVERLFLMSVKPSWMSGSGQEALPDVRQWT